MTINAALRRLMPAGMRDVSATGCLLELKHAAQIGAVGLVEVVIDGTRYADWFRVVRVDPPAAPGEPHLVGVEFLQLALAGDESLRAAMARRRVGEFPRIKLAGSGKLSGNSGRSAAAPSPADVVAGPENADFGAEAADPTTDGTRTKVATRLLDGRWRARITRVRQRQQEKTK